MSAAFSPYWIPAQPLVLASQSRIRLSMLEAAGLPVETRAANIDERAIAKEYGGAENGPDKIAVWLSQAKALAVSSHLSGRHVLAADQTLTLDGEAFHKAGTLEGVRRQLERLSGQTHCLNSAATLAFDGKIIFSIADSAQMTMRALSPAFLDHYVGSCGEAVLSSVGCYQIENHGVQLFEKISGDQFTIMGLPLVQLLQKLRQHGLLTT
ncbi:MAG: septum formation inhibitor Maf [Alphaproteobacteria bacterium]|nr:septum formation inhibitor Maf [Alphaproteobacteria bacterium]